MGNLIVLVDVHGSEELSCDDLTLRSGYVVILDGVKIFWNPSEVRLYYSQITAGLYLATMVLVWGLS